MQLLFFGFSDIKHKEYPEFREVGSIKTQLMIKIIKKNHNMRPASTEIRSCAERRLKLLWSAQEAVMGPSPPWNAGTGSWGKMEKCDFLAQTAQWDMTGFQSWAQRRVTKLRRRRMSWVSSVHLTEGRGKIKARTGYRSTGNGRWTENKITWETKPWIKISDGHRGTVSHFKKLKMAKRGEKEGLESSRRP